MWRDHERRTDSLKFWPIVDGCKAANRAQNSPGGMGYDTGRRKRVLLSQSTEITAGRLASLATQREKSPGLDRTIGI